MVPELTNSCSPRVLPANILKAISVDHLFLQSDPQSRVTTVSPDTSMISASIGRIQLLTAESMPGTI